jgi:hypothetical protein
MTPAVRQSRRIRVGGRFTGVRMVLLVLVLLGTLRGQDTLPETPGQTAAGGVSILRADPGFSDGASSVVRADYCMPIRVQVSNRTGGRFFGTLQVVGRDRDGETVIHELPGFAVDAGTVDAKQFSFVARNPGMYSTSTEISVRLLDSKDGRLVASETAPMEYIKESEHLVLDISPQSIKPVIQAALPNDDAMRFRGQVRAVYMPPDSLPGFWQELEAVDVIVCDQPDSAALGDGSLKVLAQWVRQGGLLVLGPGSLQSLAASDLGKVLPASPGAARRLPPGKTRLDGLNTSLTLDLAHEVGAWELLPRPDARTLLTWPNQPVLKQSPAGADPRTSSTLGGVALLVRRRVGFGAIVQAGISLRTLLDVSSKEGMAVGMGTRIKSEIFGIRTLDAPAENQNSSTLWGIDWPNGQGPSELLQGQADFRATGTLLATLLMLLIIVYGLLATVGSWVVLKRRKLTQHSWVVFAAVAVVGSVGAAMLVQSMRGIRADVKQQSVIDMDGPAGLARIHTFFGLKMPYDARVDVAVTTLGREELPPDQQKEAYIRPASDLERATGDSFAVKRDYTIRYGQTQLPAVPVRATVKQFESCWYGPTSGTILASLTVAPGGQLAGGSWIANNTDMDLRECYLIYARTNSLTRSQRDGLIDVVRLDALPAGKSRRDLDLAMPSDAASTRLDTVTRQWLSNTAVQSTRRGHEPPVDRSDGSRGLTAAMVSLLSDLPSESPGGYMQGQSGKIKPFTELPREGARWLDLRNVLDGRSALLVGLAHSPGLIRLTVDGRSVVPSSGECIVRVVLPLAGVTAE